MSREILTSAQNAQEALDLERERDRPGRCAIETDLLEKQEPTLDAATVLNNEAQRLKAISSRRKRPKAAAGLPSKAG